MAVNQIARGIHKVSERTIQKGRALIITSEDNDGYKWDEIPDGSFKVNPNTGITQIKLKGQTDWVPYGIKNDGTLSIAKDSILKEEKFVIIDPDATSASGNIATRYKTNDIAYTVEKPSKYQYKFELKKGEYMPERNHLEVDIDGVLERSVAGGEIIETSSTSFVLNEPEALQKGQVITVRYIQVMRIGNPYPRVFYTATEPENAEEGDLYLDRTGTVEDSAEKVKASAAKVPWSKISGTPTSLSGYGITDKVSREGHLHTVSDIKNFPTSMKANGGNADTVGKKSVGTGVNQIPYIQSNGKLPTEVIPAVSMNKLIVKHVDGSTSTYDGKTNVTIDMTQEIPTDSVFDSQGRLVFPNGNLFWIS